MRVFRVIVASLPVLFVGATLFAQQPAVQPPQPQQPQQPRQPAGQVLPGQASQGQANQGQASQTKPMQNQQNGGHGQGAIHSSNDAIAACLAIDNQEEIQLAQFAKDKAKDSQVKEFATMLVEEHKTCLAAINKAAPISSQLGMLKDTNTTSDRSTNENAQQNRNQTGTNTSTSNQPNGGMNGASLDMVQLHREMAEQCLKDSKEMLSEKKDAEFDQCFIGMQLAKHAGMKSKLTVLQKHATGELKNVIADGLEKTKKHLKVAENLMKQLDENEPSDSAKKTE